VKEKLKKNVGKEKLKRVTGEASRKNSTSNASYLWSELMLDHGKDLEREGRKGVMKVDNFSDRSPIYYFLEASSLTLQLHQANQKLEVGEMARGEN